MPEPIPVTQTVVKRHGEWCVSTVVAGRLHRQTFHRGTKAEATETARRDRQEIIKKAGHDQG